MSSTKNSSKRKNIQENSEVYSRKRQKVSESIPAAGNKIENSNASTSKDSNLKTGEKTSKSKVDDKTGLKNKKHSRRIKENEDANKDCSDGKLVGKIDTEKKLKNKRKMDGKDSGENNSKEDKESSEEKAIPQNAIMYDESNDIDDTQKSVELSLSDFFDIHLYIPSQSKDLPKSKANKDKKSISSTKDSLSLSPSKSLRSIRCIEQKVPEKINDKNSIVDDKQCSSTDILTKNEKLDKKNVKGGISKSRKSKESLNKAVKGTESLKTIESEDEKRNKSEEYKSLIQKDSPKPSNSRTAIKKAIKQTESKCVPRNDSESAKPVVLGIDMSVTQCATNTPEASLSTYLSESPSSTKTDTFDDGDKISSPVIICTNENLMTTKTATEKQLNKLEVAKIVECKSIVQKDCTTETLHSKNAIKNLVNSNSVTDKIKSDSDKILKQVTESQLTKDKGISTNKIPTAISSTPDASQKDVSTSKISEIRKASSSGLLVANPAKSKTKSSNPDAAINQSSGIPQPQEESISSLKSTKTISDTLKTSQTKSSTSMTKSSADIHKPGTSIVAKDNRTNKTMSKDKSLNPDKSVQVKDSPSSQKKTNSSIKHSKVKSKSDQNVKNASSLEPSNSPKITPSDSSIVLDDKSTPKKTKPLKPNASIKHSHESPATQKETNPSKCSASVSKNLEISQISSAVSTKSSEITKQCRSDETKSNSRINKTQSSKPDRPSMEASECQNKEMVSSTQLHTAISESDTALASKCNEPPLIKKSSAKQSKETENKTNVTKLDTVVEPAAGSSSTPEEKGLSIKSPKIMKPSTSVDGKDNATADRTTTNKNITNENKSSKPNESVKKVTKSLSPQDKNNLTNKLTNTTSKANEISLNVDSNLTDKSSKSIKANSVSDEKNKMAMNISKSSNSEKQDSKNSLSRNKIISPIKPPKKTTNRVESSENKEGKNASANTKKTITCSSIPSSSDEPKKSQLQGHTKMSKLDFTNIVLLTDERDDDLKTLSFPCMKWIIKKDMGPLTAFRYINEHFRSGDYKGKTLYIMMCGIKSLFDVCQDYNMCIHYDCKYPIRYWELAGKNERFASNRLIECSRKLKEKVKMVSHKKDDIVFSGIVPICLQNIFVSDIKEHSVWSPHHHIPTDDNVITSLHQLDISGWKAVIFYNEWANKITSELKIQFNIEKEFFSITGNKKHFNKGKTLEKDGYTLSKTALSLRREKLMDAVKLCLSKMGIETIGINLQTDESIRSQYNSKEAISTKKDEGKSNSKITENPDYFLDFDGEGGKQTRDIVKCATNYSHVVLVCDERDENLKNVMLNSETKIIFKKGLGIHEAFKEIKPHILFGKGTLFIILCGIQSVCNINSRNQVQILGDNSKIITKQLIMDAKQLQESVLTSSGGLDNVIFTGILPVDYRSMSRKAKRDLLIACLNFNEWVSSQQIYKKFSHWDIVKYWFMLSNDVDNDFKLAVKEDTLAQDELGFTQQAKLYRQNVIKVAITKTWEQLKSQDLEKNLKNIDPSKVNEDLRILLKSRKIEIDDQLRNKNDKMKIDITSKTPSLQLLSHQESFSNPFEKVVIVGNVHYKSLLQKLAMDVPQMEVLADSSYNFHKDLNASIEFIEKHKYNGLRNTLWILTSDVSCITQRENHTSCQYYGCRSPISYLNTDVRWYTEGEEKAKISMRNEAQRISNNGRRFRDKMRKLFDDSCAVILCPPLPATVYISPYPLKENSAHPQLHTALSYFIGFENDVDIIEESFLEPLMYFYSNFNMEWLNLACEILLEENMCSSSLVEYKGIQGNSIQVMRLQMSNESYRTWINIMSEIICSALTKTKIRIGIPEHSGIVNAHTSAPLELESDIQKYTPVANNENRNVCAVSNHLDLKDSQDGDLDISTSSNLKTRFQSIALIGSKKNHKTFSQLMNNNVKFVEGLLDFDEKSDELILSQQNNFEGATLWVCLVDFLRLTNLVDSSWCERDRYCMKPIRILKLKNNEDNDVNKAENFVSRMIPKLNKGSAIILAPLAPSQVVLESFFKNHAYIHTFCEKSKVPIIICEKENLINHLEEYEKSWLTMIISVYCRQKILGNYEYALKEYCKAKGPLVDIIESQYLHHKALDEWVDFIEALLELFQGLMSDDILSLENSNMESRIVKNDQNLPDNASTATKSLISTKAVSTGAACKTKSGKEDIVTEKSGNRKSIKGSEISSDRTNTKSLEKSSNLCTNGSQVNTSKEMKSSKELNESDKKSLENFCNENKNESNLNREKELKNTNDSKVIESRLKPKEVSINTLMSSSVGEINVPNETNNDSLDNANKQVVKESDVAANKLDINDKESDQQLNISKPGNNLITVMPSISFTAKEPPGSVEENKSTTGKKSSKVNESVDEITNSERKSVDKDISLGGDNRCRIKQASDESQTISTQFNNTKNLLNSTELSDLQKNTSIKPCNVNKPKDSDKENETLNKTKSVTAQNMVTKKETVCSNAEAIDASKVKLSGIHESINNKVLQKLLKACGPIISLRRNKKGYAEVSCDGTTAARVARIFNQLSMNNKSIQATLIKDSSKCKESLPKLTDIEKSIEDREAIKKIEEILNNEKNVCPLKFQPQSLSCSTSKPLALENMVSNPEITSSTAATPIPDSKDLDINIENEKVSGSKGRKINETKENKGNEPSGSNTSNEDLNILKKIKAIDKSIIQKDPLEKTRVNKNKEDRMVRKEYNKNSNVTADEAPGEHSVRIEKRSLLENETEDKNENRKKSKTIRPKGNEDAISNSTQEKLSQVEKKIEKKKDPKENEDRISTNKLTSESSAEKKVSSLDESRVSDGKRRRSRSRSQSPYKRSRRKSSGSQTKEKNTSEKELSNELKSNIQESSAVSRLHSPYKRSRRKSSGSQSKDKQSPENDFPPELISNVKESASITQHRLDHHEESFENDPILNELPDGFRSQLDDTQWMEFVSKLKAQYNRHRSEYDDYYQDPEMHDDYELKRDSFMEMLEKEKPSTLQEEKDELWNQFWKVELANCDESKWKQWKNRLIKVTLKKAHNSLTSNCAKATPISSKTCLNIKGKLEEKVKIKSEPIDMINTELTKVKEEKIDFIGNTNFRVKVENNIKIESDKTEIGTSIKNESPFIDVPIPPLNFENDVQIDPEAFVKDLDFLQNEYVAIGDEQEDNNSSETSTRILSDPSETTGRLMNPEYERSPSICSLGRIKSPEFNFGEKQEFYLKKEKNFDEDFTTKKQKFVNIKEDSILNVNTDKNVLRSEELTNHPTDCLPIHQTENIQVHQSEDFVKHPKEGLLNHQNNNINSDLTELDIIPKEKFKVKDALNTIERVSDKLPLLGPILNKFINKIKIQPSESPKELELLQDKNFLLLLGASAQSFGKESERISDDILKCLLDVGRQQALDLIKYAKSKQSVCVHGVNIENIAQRTIDKTAKECRQFIETAIMYETNTSAKPSENVVKEIYSKISEIHYKMLSGRDTNKVNVK